MSTDYGLPRDYGSSTHEKTPDETIRVNFHFAERLDGDTISTTVFELPDGLTSVGEYDEDSVQGLLVSGGTHGRVYRVVCKVTTHASAVYQQVRRIVVREG